jgi:hypothetical protein
MIHANLPVTAAEERFPYRSFGPLSADRVALLDIDGHFHAWVDDTANPETTRLVESVDQVLTRLLQAEIVRVVVFIVKDGNIVGYIVTVREHDSITFIQHDGFLAEMLPRLINGPTRRAPGDTECGECDGSNDDDRGAHKRISLWDDAGGFRNAPPPKR